MDTKFQSDSRIKHPFRFVGIALIVAFALLTGALSCILEDKIHFEGDNLSYIHDNSNINSEVIRYAKNLQRFYIYYANFDVDIAKKKLNEIDSYLSKTSGTLYSDNLGLLNSEYYHPYTTEDGIDFELYTDGDVDYPETLYDINLKSLSITEIMAAQSNLSEAISNYDSIKNYLDSNNDFHFYLYSTYYGRVVATNTTDFLNENVYDLVTTEDSMFSDVYFNNEYLSKSFSNNMLLCSISIPSDTSSYFIKQEIANTQNMLSINDSLVSFATPAFLFTFAIIILLFLIYLKKEAVAYYNSKVYSWYLKIPLLFKVSIFLFLTSSLLYYTSQSTPLTSALFASKYLTVIMYFITFMFTIIYFLFTFEYIYHIFRKPRQLSTETDIRFIRGVFRDLKMTLDTNNYLLTVMYLMVVIPFLFTTGLLIFLVFLCIDTHNIAYALLAVTGFIPMFILFSFLKLISNYAKLSLNIERLLGGDMTPTVESNELFSGPANSLNHISEGLQLNLDKMIKNERLKTELITNVSHDLKTPLTSIISYVALLRDLHIENADADKYIDVIDNKSKRLKILIEDLFEASKLSSGQLKLVVNTSDIVSLLNQTLGELEQKISDSQIEFKVNIPDKPIMVNIDGERMWRVFDNLLNNILKYSPQGSRAYISVTENTESVAIIFKNISNYPLDFEPSELFERFKRGDVSRSTEGSGLGLSIAQNIVELHGGTLDIIIDGDLFKTIIVLNKNTLDK